MSEGNEKSEMTVVQSGEVTVNTVGFSKGVELTNLEEAWRFAGLIAKASDMCPAHFRGKPEAVLAAIQRGAEMGLSPMQSINSIYVVKGKTAMSGQVMLAMMNRPDVMEPGYRTHAGSDTDENGELYGWVRSRRRGDKEWLETKFTMAEAKAMGLTGRRGDGPSQYELQPGTMLMWRAISKHSRIYYSDVMLGVYLPEEVPMVAEVQLEETPPKEWEVTGATDPLVAELVEEIEEEPTEEIADDPDYGPCPDCGKVRINLVYQEACDACIVAREESSDGGSEV